MNINLWCRAAALAAVLILPACDRLDDLIGSALVESVEVSPDTATLSVGEMLQLSATLRDGADSLLVRRPTWISRDPAVATVDSVGRVRGVGVGIARVEASADGRVAASAIRVVPLVATVSVSPDSLTLGVGEAVQLGAALGDRHGAPVRGISPAWRSTEPGVARVDAEGRVQALAMGTARVVAETEAAADTALVWVVPRVARVAVTPDTLTLGESESVQLGVTLIDRHGTPVQDVAPAWRSSEPAVATVDAGGRVTARRVGVARIVASAGPFADTATLRVVPRVSSVGLSPDTATLRVGEFLRLGVTVRDRNGLALSDATVVWSSVEPEVATVDGNGRVDAVAQGVARIVATSGAAADTARVRVLPRPAGTSASAAAARRQRPQP